MGWSVNSNVIARAVAKSNSAGNSMIEIKFGARPPADRSEFTGGVDRDCTRVLRSILIGDENETPRCH